MDKLLRGLSSSANQSLASMAPRKAMPQTESGKERPDTNSVMVHALSIYALGYPYSYRVMEVEDLAIKIAGFQRHKNELQDREIAQEKLIKEKRELDMLLVTHYTEGVLLSRVASVAYYIAYSFLHTYEIATFHYELDALAEKSGIRDKALLMALCVRKFEMRTAYGVQSNKEAEQRELARLFEQSAELVAKPLD